MSHSVGTRKAILKHLEAERNRIYGATPGFAFEPFKGIMAATFTAFSDDSYSLDLSNVEKYANDLVQQRITGVFLNGTSGQSTSLSLEERKELLDAWMKTDAVKSKKIKAIAHVGGNSIVDMITLAKHAAQYPVQGIGLMSPSYYKPKSDDDLAELLARVAHVVPNIPIYYYHIPFMNGINVCVCDMLLKARNLAPNVAGVKFTDMNLADLQRCSNNGFNVLVGADDMLSYALAAGADGAIGITYNFTGTLHTEILDKMVHGNHSEAHDIQKISTELMHNIKASGDLNAACFYLFEKLRGISLGAARFPVYKLDDDKKPALDSYLNELKEKNIVL